MNHHTNNTNFPLVGAKVVAFRPMLINEYTKMGWAQPYGIPTDVAIDFDDGTTIFAMSDEEGNNPGTFAASIPDGRIMMLIMDVVDPLDG